LTPTDKRIVCGSLATIAGQVAAFSPRQIRDAILRLAETVERMPEGEGERASGDVLISKRLA
jgi:hypothetical protein